MPELIVSVTVIEAVPESTSATLIPDRRTIVSSSVVQPAAGKVLTGASFTAAIVKFSVFVAAAVSVPPLAVPPSSRTRNVNAPVAAALLKLLAPWKARLPAAMSAAVTKSPASTATPLSVSRPCAAGGRVTMTTPANALPSTGSENPKLASVSTSGVSSMAASVAFVPVGGSLRAVTVIVAVSTSICAPPEPVPPLSFVVMVSVTRPLAFAAGT